VRVAREVGVGHGASVHLYGKAPRPGRKLGHVTVVARARGGDDDAAIEALDTFIKWLGAFTGDAALFFGARGGVYLGGGIAPKLVAKLSSGSFRRAFEDKGRMAAYLAPIAIYVIGAEFATLTGAAASLRAAANP